VVFYAQGKKKHAAINESAAYHQEANTAININQHQIQQQKPQKTRSPLKSETRKQNTTNQQNKPQLSSKTSRLSPLFIHLNYFQGGCLKLIISAR
jgi:hypothetical protein